MTGIIDVGGGMRGVYTAGIYDCLIDLGITADYCLGVSAGSANMVTYIAGQRGRNKRFYTQYARRKEYMSFRNLLRRGSYLDLDYIYSVLSNSDGEDPFDYDAFMASPCQYVAVATGSWDGKPYYFTRDGLRRDRYDVVKASCALPIACKPYPLDGAAYFDGGISDPIPYRKALTDGCDKLLVLLTRPRDYIRPPLNKVRLKRFFMRRYPAVMKAMLRRHLRYNADLEAVKELERTGKALLLGPADIDGMSTLKWDPMVMERLYGYGYQDGAKAAAFLR